ncbi:MAG: peptidoglycan DD-metalloendopeptidase family protein [Sphingorhabdus sp.]
MQRLAWGIAAFSTLVLTGCIPPGAGDSRIRSSSTVDIEQADPKAYPREPVIVPEREIVAETPAWSPASVERNARLVAQSDYIVRSGDSLFAIATMTGAGATAIAEANGLAPPYILKAGQRLQIPGGLFHRVGSGETGIAIARAYGLSWADVVALNRLPPPYILQVGQNLRLPDSASAIPVSADTSPETRAAGFTLDIDSIVTGGNPARAVVLPITAAPATYGGSFAWPIGGAVVSRFGSLGGGRVNDGIKIAGSAGAPVAAAGDGVVVYAGNEIAVLGGLVLVDHGGGWMTAYGHLGSLDVAKGQRVTRGQRLGGVGDTGYADSPQLHFEIRRDRKPLNPLLLLPGNGKN